ncbi:hypothetical protein O181_102487 [Austropuccinia psidii MF-1]|uniref:Uncharacterized protein n=1 Tax=Austropuccinia psidii MF-1 TaxID=1389203 RepID=A0A9Q3JJ97_9BASI|nr:hypothetical protein [Austropuccinia psidii MF-1]
MVAISTTSTFNNQSIIKKEDNQINITHKKNFHYQELTINTLIQSGIWKKIPFQIIITITILISTYRFYYPVKEGTQENQTPKDINLLIATPRPEQKEKEKLRRFFFKLIQEARKKKKSTKELKGYIYQVKMDQQSTSELSPLPENTVEGQYAEESEEEDQTVQIQSLMKQIQDLFLTQSRQKGKRREQTAYTPGASPSEPTLPRNVRPEDSPISPKHGPRATCTPKTEQRSQSILKKVFLTTPNHPSLLQKEIPKVTSPIVKIRAKDYNLFFDGNKVQKFIKRVEAAAEIAGASGEDIERQVLFMSASEEVKAKIEAMQGYEEKNWTKLKEILIIEWGRVEPDRGYRPKSLEKLFNNTKREGGIRNLAEYKRFIGEYEKITNYLYKYGYIRRESEHNEELYASLSPEIRTSIIKEMRRDKVIIQARDGGYIVPEMKVLKSYIEQELETVIISRDRSQDTNSHYELNQPHIDKTKAKKVQFEDDTMGNSLNQLKELNNKIKEQQRPRIQDQEEKKEIKDFIKQIKELTEAVLPQNKTGQVFKQENQARYPKDSLPPFSQRHIPYTPAQNIPKPYVKCYYCLEEGHCVNRCNYLFDDQNKKWVSRQGGGFLFPNWQRIPTDGKIAPKKLVADFSKEKEELTNKMKEDEAKEALPKPNQMSIIQLKKDDSATAIAKAENWGSWQPPTMSSANEPLLYNYGLINTKEKKLKSRKYQSRCFKITFESENTNKKDQIYL